MKIETTPNTEYTQLEIIEDVINGIYSGIPKCCIEFFLQVNSSIPRGVPIARYVHEVLRGLDWNSKSSFGAEYVQCCKCHAEGSTVDIKKNGYVLLGFTGNTLSLEFNK